MQILESVIVVWNSKFLEFDSTLPIFQLNIQELNSRSVLKNCLQLEDETM